MITRVMKNGYRFYKIDNEYYGSITGIGKLLHKEKLQDWAIRQTIEYIAKQGNTSPTTLSNAFKYHKKYLLELADEGTEKHKLAADYFKYKKYVKDAWLDRLVKWEKKVGFVTKPKLIERTLYSKEHKCAGTADLIGFIHEEPILIDIKTSSGIYLSQKIQVCGYNLMLPKPIKLAILDIPRNAKCKRFHILDEEEIRVYTKVFLDLNDMFQNLLKMGDLGVDIHN